MSDFLSEALGLCLRWLHVVAAIAWIGESFYFVALDRGLSRPKIAEPGLHGESWSVHGGGFYRKQKYLPAPAELPDILHWSKWKSYTTWLSGFGLFVVLYLFSPTLYLIDPAVAALSPDRAIALAIGLLVAGWLIYDRLCHWLESHDRLLGVSVAVLTAALSYAATHLFAGRAAFLLVGAALATIMSANVFFVIIPGQKRLVAALTRGEAPDPLPGLRGKQRSVHNTYFTLPVVFAMLSTHYATAFAHTHSWLVLLMFMAAGAAIRQFFVLWHSGERAWWLVALAGGLLLGVFFWLAPKSEPSSVPVSAVSEAPPALASPDASDEPIDAALESEDRIPETAIILPLLAQHCSACHSAKPALMASAPKGIAFDTAEQTEAYAALIHRQAVVLKTMPPGNATGLSDQGRATIDRWFRSRGTER